MGTTRTTINLDDDLLSEARRLTGIEEKTTLIHTALRELIAREAARRLAALGGNDAEARSWAQAPVRVILVDTSRWVDHFRAGDPQLAGLLEEGLVGAHAFVIGELACGNLKDRAKTLDFFMRLPRISGATDSEVHHCVEAHRLWGLGLGWVDLHLLTAAAISGWSLLTADRALTAAAAKLGLRSGR